MKNVNPNAPKCWIKAFDYFKNNNEKFEEFYHRRSNVETVFAMIKVRLGEFLRAKNFVSQRNELIMKFIVHNITCLIQELFENEVHIDFRKCMDEFVERKVPDDYPESTIRDIDY